MTNGQILLIDDDPDFSLIIREVVKMESYTFTGVQKVDCLTSLMQKHSPDLVLLDFCLKGRNGGELCCFIRNELRLQLPVVLLSTYPEAQLPLAQIPFPFLFLNPLIFGVHRMSE
ncbi:response regulator [Mucilaginibacter roseus]|uniref:Response regulator n=1 Tax=Mucilaginibacter roseus TaxID=1528868 RepID=A0ABS8TW68_9SPHI|nr:response regulator [Mucilaginibacter roseus]MCD8739120.1 response regulator [Mucilaginibacter roseus]